MAGNVARVAFAVFLLNSLTSISTQASQEPRAVPSTPSWTLEVLTFETAIPTALWVGLSNRSSEARLVCVADRGLSYTEKDGTIKAVGEGGSAHACDVDQQFQLVRAGQTQFIRLPITKELSTTVTGRIRVELGVVDRPLTGRTLRREPVGVTWEGTLQEAADRGRALDTAAKKGK